MIDEDLPVIQAEIPNAADLHPNPSIEPCHTPLVIIPGAFVEYDGTVYRVSEVIDFQTVIAVSVTSGRSHSLAIQTL